MSQWRASQLSTDSGRAPTAEELLVNVKQLIEQPEFNLNASNRVPFSERTRQYSQILASLSDILSQFPRADESATSQRLELAVSLARLSLDAMERVSQRMEGCLSDYEREFSRKLLICSAAVEGWVQGDAGDLEDAEDLRERILQVLIGALQILVREASSAGKKLEHGSYAVVSCLEGIVSALHEISDREVSDYPFTINILESQSSQTFSQQPVDQKIHLTTPDHAIGFALNQLQIVTRILQSSKTMPFLMAHFIRPCLEATASLIFILLKSSSPRTQFHFTRLLLATETLAELAPDHFKTVQQALFRLLASRLNRGPDAPWDIVDSSLATLLTRTIDTSVLTTNVVEHVPQLASEMDSQEHLTVAVHAYLAHYAIRCPPPVLSTIEAAAVGRAQTNAIQNIHVIIMNRSSLTAVAANGVNGHASDWQEHSMQNIRDGLFKELQIEMSASDLMDVDDENWQLGVIRRLNEQFDSLYIEPSSECRIILAKHFSELPRTLVDPSHSTASEVKLPLAHLYARVTRRLLEGPLEQVTVEVRRLVYNALAEGLKYHESERGEPDDLRIDDLIEADLEHKNRLVRLAAGRVLVEIWKLGQGVGEARSNAIVSDLKRRIKVRRDHIKETSLITLGSIGRVASMDKLSSIIFILICELGNSNPVLRGVAFQQLSALAQREKSAYSLVATNMAQIALHIASNCAKQPLLLAEFCRFISYSPASFLTQTLLDYLPDLVARRSGEELSTIARITETTVAALIIEKPAEVLERVFMLDGDTETDRALDFIFQHLPTRNPSSQRSLGMVTLVKSKLMSLLGRILIQLGDEDPWVKEQAIRALSKVEKYVNEPTTGKKSVIAPHSFLRQHIMGIITHLNDELQEAHGKRSRQAKCKVLRGIKEVMLVLGDLTSIVAPQLVAIMQNTVNQEGLATPTTMAWHTLATVLKPVDFVPYLALTSAIFADSWPRFDDAAKGAARETLILIMKEKDFRPHLKSIASFEDIEDLQDIQKQMAKLTRHLLIEQKLELVASRILDVNATVSQLAIGEVTKLVSDHESFYPLINGDLFDPIVGHLVKALHTVAGREGEVYEASRLAAFQCLGIIGAVDPDRFEIPRDLEDLKLSFCDFDDDAHSQKFAIHLFADVLTPIFPKTSDTKFQSQLAYTIQELLRFCGFTESLIAMEHGNPVSAKIRSAWSRVPGDVRATVAPLLGSKYSIGGKVDVPNTLPIYPSASTYKEWIQKFTSYLISQVSGKNAPSIFLPFRALLSSADVQVLIFLLPHLVLECLSNDAQERFREIREEIVAVVEDQVNPLSAHSSEMKLLCAQMIFHLMDHLNKYLRFARTSLAHGKRSKSSSLLSRHRVVEALATSIDHGLMAQAAYNCKQYARAMMSLEQRVMHSSDANSLDDATLQDCYEQMHRIYANLDEPDGMNGISSKVLSPSVEHQIREHESNGRWTAAQSCWEVSLQQDPNKLDSQVGLLRCLRNLGHFDTMRTHLAGVLTRNPEWGATLEPFKLEGAWTANDWTTVEEIVSTSHLYSPELSIGKLLLALRTGNQKVIDQALSSARLEFGQPIGAGGPQSYRRTYDASVHLHMVEELSTISRNIMETSVPRRSGRENRLLKLSRWLDDRYDSVLPSYRTLEPILSLRRSAFDLLNSNNPKINALVGHYWLVSSKVARKAGHLQAAYSSLLQGRHRGASYHFIQGCKLLQSNGDAIRALQELNNALVLRREQAASDVIDLTEPEEDRLDRAKAWLLRARWMEASERYSRVELNLQYSHVTQLYEGWESSYFHWALYLDRSQEHKGVSENQLEEYVNHIDHVVRHYGRSLKYGSKHLYQTLPRMLTLWLNLGQRSELQTQKGVSTADHAHRSSLTKFGLLCDWIKDDLVENMDPFKWLTAFPQIVSIIHSESGLLSRAIYTIVGKVIQEFPQQSLWILTGVAASRKKERREAAARALGFTFNEKFYGRGLDAERKKHLSVALERVRPLTGVYSGLNRELLHLCNFEVGTTELHSVDHKCPLLRQMDLSEVIIPLQNSFTTKIPPMSSYKLLNQPFPHTLPTIKRFMDDIQVMPSLQKPRKIGIEASNGEQFFFLCKPKDDLRKDARLMDFNSVVNKLLRANSESRRRQLHIRTYSVVPLNEECGLIEWVRNTSAFRALLKRRYDATGTSMMPKRIMEYFDKLKVASPEQAARIFETKVLAEFKPLFHEWFLETFPEPTAWFSSRLNYSRTAAVISMVGYIIGLGDRHCENIMLDEGTGETVHCDFNCLFDKGKQFEVPELVPFRLTQNVVDGMGITGVEGPFRVSCEITMELLRSNQDCLMSVLEAFIHDPLVEWEDAQRRQDRRRENFKPVDLRKLALNALDPIERKLQGMEGEKQISVSNQVDKLIQDAMSLQKLGKMYVGWTPWV